MTTTKSTQTTFALIENGETATYKRSEKGYCSRNGKRISAKAFAEAEQAREAEMVAEADAAVAAAKEIADRASDLPEGIDPEQFAEWMAGQPADKWDEEEAAEIEVEVPETEGNTEQVYAEEKVPEFEIEGVNKSQASVGHVNGHEYVHDWFGKRYFRDGEEISKAEFDHEVHGDEAPKEAKPRTKRTRRPKDVAGTYETSEGTVTLTAKQLDFLHELGRLTEDDLLGTVQGGCWCDVLCDAIGGQFCGKPMTVGAMLSTVCEKGLGIRNKERRDTNSKGKGRLVTTFRLTPKGQQVWEQLGL